MVEAQVVGVGHVIDAGGPRVAASEERRPRGGAHLKKEGSQFRINHSIDGNSFGRLGAQPR
jgi:hypothetical protein